MKFRGEYSFLSNMYACSVPIVIDGRLYRFKNAEAAYQAGKCPSRAAEFENLDGPSAKRLGRRMPLSPHWDGSKLAHMTDVLASKFKNNPYLACRLKAINGPIVEENDWGDKYWGVCRGAGQNHLGKLLTQLRDKL